MGAPSPGAWSVPVSDGSSLPQIGLDLRTVPVRAASLRLAEWFADGWRHVVTSVNDASARALRSALATSGVARPECYVTAVTDRPDPAVAFDDFVARAGIGRIDMSVIAAGPTEQLARRWAALRTLHMDGLARGVGIAGWTAEVVDTLVADIGLTPQVHLLDAQAELTPALASVHRRHEIVTIVSVGGITVAR